MEEAVSDRIEAFLKASIEDRLRMARGTRSADAIRAYLGAEAFEEYRRIAAHLDTQHLAVGGPKNLVFVPGVMGSLLQSRTKGGIWWVDVRTRNHIDDLQLSPDGRSDADASNDVGPSTTDPLYEPFLSAILKRSEFNQELFPYDWRKSLMLSSRGLRDLVVRLYSQNGRKPVHLVGHSMGGLTIRTCLMEHGDELWPLLGRVVFIGTPHYGSPAISGYLKNHLWGFEALAILGLYLSRATFRSLWGVLGMLPAPRGIYPGTRANDPHPWASPDPEDAYIHPCANFDMYRAESWDLELDNTAGAHLQAVLDGAAQFHKEMADAHFAASYEHLDRILVIAGVGYKTLFRLAYKKGLFGLWEHANKERGRVPGDPHRDGDGRVPLASALLEGVTVRYVKGVHSGLPNIPAVYEDTFRWLKSEALQLSSTPEEALSQHLAKGEESESPLLDGSARAIPSTDDPGLWSFDPAPDELEGLRAHVEAEEPQWFNLARML
jgi:pimeloyl-ACP methyl ester carboxylesterase